MKICWNCLLDFDNFESFLLKILCKSCHEVELIKINEECGIFMEHLQKKYNIQPERLSEKTSKEDAIV